MQDKQSGGQPEGTLELKTDYAIIIVKAAPRRSESFGETVCCAGIDQEGRWVRLYPVSFRQLLPGQKFGRWDRIRYRWSKPKATKDQRCESRRVDPNSIEIVGVLPEKYRDSTLNRSVVSSLRREHSEGRSLALLKPDILNFWYERKSDEDFRKEQGVLDQLNAQTDLFAPEIRLLPKRACPYVFKYKYRDEDGEHTGTCQDWETEQTFFARLRDQASEQAALDWVQQKFGDEYPRNGMALAMGTHRYRHEQWLINGVVRMNEVPQMDLF